MHWRSVSARSCARGRRISSMVIERRRETAFAVLIVVLGLFLAIAGSAAAGTDSPVPAVNADQGIGLKGYDPVAYFINGAPTKGTEQYSFARKGVTYRFASAGNLEKFKADPEKYLPQYGGYFADAMSLDRIAEIDPSRWAIFNRKLYLNNGFLAAKLLLLK